MSEPPAWNPWPPALEKASNCSTNGSGVPCARSWIGICSRNPWPNSVPTIASPTEPPICRKKVRLDVATPSCWTGTAFWTTTVKTLNVGPMPSPSTNIQNQRDGSGVSDRS
jgi:hypothetical protein